MEVLLIFDEDEFVNLLNGDYSTNKNSGWNAMPKNLKPGQKLSGKEMVMVFNALPKFWQPSEEFKQQNPELPSIARLLNQEAQRPHLAKSLRRYVDQWIKSGYIDELEYPGRRNIPSQIPSKKPGGRPRESEIWKKLESFLAENPINLTLSKRGSPVAVFPEPNEDSWGNDETVRRWLGFMDSELRTTIAKCLKCGTYFKRSRVQEYYKRGALCKAHSVSEGVTQARARKRKLRLEVASKAFQSWTARKRRPLKDWIAHHVNKSPKTEGITGKWVSRHLREIEAMACDSTDIT
ncbi:hypothetical protein [Acidipila rosea]|uniref:Uncharacterized protein n=1 Tax=Acidipila rosea TaxID=768535 RepID=A0A4R1L369_9BACT|nr:hypothetical protein [Acidipila rosea]TCK72465.1 hypothetical protein C7378_2042 [Acidipila rosea]